MDARRAAAETTQEDEDDVVGTTDFDCEMDLLVVVIIPLPPGGKNGEGDRLVDAVPYIDSFLAFNIASLPILANKNCSDARGIIHIRARPSNPAASSGFSPRGRKRSGRSQRMGTSDSNSLVVELFSRPAVELL